MAEYDEQGMAIAAAEILLSLRSRKLARWPEWVPRPSGDLTAAPTDLQRPEEAEDELPPIPEGWPKRPRLPPRAVSKGTAWLLPFESLLAQLGQPVLARSGACSSGEERARSHPRVTKVKREPLAARRQETPPYYVSAAGSVPSTSGIDRARSRRRARVSEKAQATATATATAWTDGAMAASSPETPFDYANAAGSGASSSGDEVARSTAKRKAQGSGGSVGPSSGDEGCSSPAKRARPDVAGAGAAQPAAAAVKVEDQKAENNYRDEKGHLMFDLNEDPDMAEW